MILRAARLDDAPHLVALKRALPMPQDAETDSGGFLLGATEETYHQLIAHANVWVLDTGAQLDGFAITLPDPVLRASDVWARRSQIRWSADDVPLDEDRPVGYFEQLAVRPSTPRVSGLALALHATAHLLRAHAHLFTTTVAEPVLNRAALPYLELAGARAVGTIDETYPEVGRIVSTVHHLDGATFAERRRGWMDGAYGRVATRVESRLRELAR